MLEEVALVKILVIHNNERDRLAYLVPQLEALARDLTTAGHATSVQLVGSDIDFVKERDVSHNFANRFRRALDAASMYCSCAVDGPNPMSRHRLVPYYVKKVAEHVRKYKRSVRIEQEVVSKHVYCLRETALSQEPALVLENDAIVHEQTKSGLLAVLNYLKSIDSTEGRYYVDLAGGGDRKEILKSWCFESKHGCKDFTLTDAPGLTLHALPRMTTNTVGGYLISPLLAAELFDFFLTKRPFVGIDWSFNLFAAQPKNATNVLCIHTTPTLFIHGSASGPWRAW